MKYEEDFEVVAEHKLDYKSDIAIDQFALDYELIRQASLYQKYSELYANAAYERDRLKEKVEQVKADVALDVRQNFAEWGFTTKPTDAAVKETVAASERVEDAIKQSLESTRRANKMYGIKCSFDNKKSALESMVRLYVSGYFGTPKGGKEVDQVVQEKSIEQMNDHLKSNPRMVRRMKKENK